MPKQKGKTGAKKPGRPPVTERAGRFVHTARSAGLPDEQILGGVAPQQKILQRDDLQTAERHDRIRDTLNRWEKRAGISTAPVDRERERARADLAYALRRLGDEWIQVSREPGWTVRAGDTLAGLEAVAAQIRVQIDAIRAAKRSGILAVPMTREADGGCAMFEGKVAAIGERVEELRRADRRERKRAVTASVSKLSTSDYARLSPAERENLERDLGLDIGLDEWRRSDAMGALTVEYADDRRAGSREFGTVRGTGTTREYLDTTAPCPMCGDDRERPDQCPMCS